MSTALPPDVRDSTSRVEIATAGDRDGAGGVLAVLDQPAGPGVLVADVLADEPYRGELGDTIRRLARQRSAVRSPITLLSEINAQLRSHPAEPLATAVLAIATSDPGGPALRVVRAGHPAVWSAGADGESRWVAPPGHLLGVLPDARVTEHVHRMAPGEVVMLHGAGFFRSWGVDAGFDPGHLDRWWRARVWSAARRSASAVRDDLAAATGTREVPLAVLAATEADVR